MEYDIDFERLREDLKFLLEGAYFVAHFGGAIIQRDKIDSLGEEELLRVASEKGTI